MTDRPRTRLAARRAAAAALVFVGASTAACRTSPRDAGVTNGIARGVPLAALPARTALDSLTDRALRHAASQLRRTAETLDPARGWPRVTRADGSWEQVRATDWTSGFFPGQLWYMYELTGDPYWRTQGDRWTAGIEPVKDHTRTHDLGFMIHDSFGHGYRLTGNPHYRDVVLHASRTLARRYSPVVGAIKSWDTDRHTDHRRTWEYPVIVDNLMNLEMLWWASKNGGDASLGELATRHALTSLRAHVRPDASTAHVALFDPRTGALLRTVTWQGAGDSTAWARGQAWAMHGLTTAYRETRRPEFLDGARRVSDYFLARLPADQVPYWDFQAPGIPNAPRDASAGALAASALFELSGQVGGADGARYRAAAERILGSLCANYLSDPARSAAILDHATGQHPQGAEIDVGLGYADYYLVEALVRYRKLRRG